MLRRAPVLPATRWQRILTPATHHLAGAALPALRMAIGLIYIWFGALKFVSGASPAAQLATSTMSSLTFDTVPASVSRPLLAVFETLIGLGFLSGRLRRLVLAAFLTQVLGALSSLVLAPNMVWHHAPLEPNLAGQYVLKDLVLLAAGLLVLTAPNSSAYRLREPAVPADDHGPGSAMP
ncbi:DoxX family protein [Catenulispora subtropica]|uniref:DoxX family protein n=1 Tax=Catenulispora subtropica TaxID=450798 RepID=A0ABP5CU03_9ACTN